MSVSLEAAEAAMSATISALRDEHRRGVLEVESSFDLFSDGTAKTAARGALRMEGERIDDLATVKRDWVRSGQWTLQKWAERAELIHGALAYYSRESGDWKMLSVLGSAAAATGEDIKKGATEAVKAAPSVALYVGGLLVLIIIARVVFLVR